VAYKHLGPVTAPVLRRVIDSVLVSSGLAGSPGKT
jgi:hypothetical protein